MHIVCFIAMVTSASVLLFVAQIDQKAFFSLIWMALSVDTSGIHVEQGNKNGGNE